MGGAWAHDQFFPLLRLFVSDFPTGSLSDSPDGLLLYNNASPSPPPRTRFDELRRGLWQCSATFGAVDRDHKCHLHEAKSALTSEFPTFRHLHSDFSTFRHHLSDFPKLFPTFRLSDISFPTFQLHFRVSDFLTSPFRVSDFPTSPFRLSYFFSGFPTCQPTLGSTPSCSSLVPGRVELGLGHLNTQQTESDFG